MRGWIGLDRTATCCRRASGWTAGLRAATAGTAACTAGGSRSCRSPGRGRSPTAPTTPARRSRSRTRCWRYLAGEDPEYPEAALRAELDTLRTKVEGMRADHRAPDMSMSDDMNRYNPATVGGLIQLMLGGMPTGRDVHTLFAQVRYFDPAGRRAGLPAQVGALVERMTEDEVTLQLVNLDPVDEKVVVVQGGAYGEHQIVGVRSEAVKDGGAEASEAILLGRALGGRRARPAA